MCLPEKNIFIQNLHLSGIGSGCWMLGAGCSVFFSLSHKWNFRIFVILPLGTSPRLSHSAQGYRWCPGDAYVRAEKCLRPKQIIDGEWNATSLYLADTLDFLDTLGKGIITILKGINIMWLELEFLFFIRIILRVSRSFVRVLIWLLSG